jgi:hypothetical protein
MRYLRILFFLACLAVPVAALPALSAGDLPDAAKWYFHADFKEMRSNESGRHIYDWLQTEVFEEIAEETGVDLDKEADFLTAFSSEDGGMVVVIEGNISQDTEDKVVAMAAASGSMDRFGKGAGAYYHVKDNDRLNGGDIDIDVDSFDNGAYFSFAVNDKLLVTSTAESMQSLLDAKGKISGTRATRGQLFVLTAERNLMQAGARTSALDGDGDWDSNILRNTEQAALLVAEKAGKIALEVQLITTEAEMADSLASIVRGLISLQAFNDEMDPDIAAFVQNTRVDVDDETLTISVALDPESVIAAIE